MEPKEVEELRDEILRFLQSIGADEALKLKGLMDQLASEMLETRKSGSTDVLFCGSDGKTIIKALHFPAASLGEPEGPVLLPSADSTVILCAFADEFVQRSLDEIRNVFQDPEVREHQWEQFLNSLAVRASRKKAESPEFNWDSSVF